MIPAGNSQIDFTGVALGEVEPVASVSEGESGEVDDASIEGGDLPQKPSRDDYPDTDDGDAAYNAAADQYNAEMAQIDAAAQEIDENERTEPPIENADANEMKNRLQEEASMLKDELDDWPDDVSTREITYTEWIKNEDGSFSPHKVTKTMTKDEVKSQVSSMQNQLEQMKDDLNDGEGSISTESPFQLAEGSLLVGSVAEKMVTHHEIGSVDQSEGDLSQDLIDLNEILSNYIDFLNELQDLIEDLNNQIDQITGEINDLVIEIAERQTEIAEMQGLITDLMAERELLSEELKAMGEDARSTVTTRTLVQNPDGITYSWREESIELDYSEIQEKIKENEAQITKINEKIDTNKILIKENEELIEGRKERIKEIKEKISETQAIIIDTQREIAQIQQK